MTTKKSEKKTEIKWSKTFAEPGYYWWKIFKDDSCIIVEISKDNFGMFWINDQPITELTGYFYGPLKEPKQTIRD